MIAKNLFVASALVSLVAAIPFAQPNVAKREIVWETATETALTTIPVTVTHWLEPGETPPTINKGHYGHKGKRPGHGHSGPPPAPEPTEPAAQPQPPAYSPPESSAQPPPASSYEQPAPAPEPTTTQAPPPPPPAYTSEPAPEPAPEPSQPSYGSGSSGSSGSGLTGLAAPGTSYTGDLTYYDPGLGACGWQNTAADHIVAISEAIFDSYDNGNPNNNPLCGKMITITGADGAPYQAKIVDRCPGCDEGSLDLTPDFFKVVVPNGDGRVHNVEWSFD